MKKALICFICIVVVIIAAYGAKNISSGKQVKNDTTYEKGSEDKFVEVETYKENEEVIYKYTLLNSEGKNVYEETGLYREPNVEQLDNEVVRVGVSAGSSVY